MSRATGHISKRNRSTVDTASAPLIFLLRSILVSLLPFTPPPSPLQNKKRYGICG
jgi:hypothetical protein